MGQHQGLPALSVGSLTRLLHWDQVGVAERERTASGVSGKGEAGGKRVESLVCVAGWVTDASVTSTHSKRTGFQGRRVTLGIVEGRLLKSSGGLGDERSAWRRPGRHRHHLEELHHT